MDTELERRTQRVATRLRAVGSGRGKRYPAELRSEATEIVGELRELGWSWSKLEDNIGVSWGTLHRWLTAKRDCSEPGFRRLNLNRSDVTQSGGSGIVMVLPSGCRLENLSAQDAVHILRALA